MYVFFKKSQLSNFAISLRIVAEETGKSKTSIRVFDPIGSAQRVPVPTGSTTILTAVVKRAGVTKEDINAAMKAAANEPSDTMRTRSYLLISLV